MDRLSDAELSQTLRTAIATFTLQGNIHGQILASQAGSVQELGRTLTDWWKN
jgi:hypothetical protein